MPTIYPPPDIEHAAASADYFTNALRAVASPVDQRSESQLLRDGFAGQDPRIREQALFEFAYRQPEVAFGVLFAAVNEELDRARSLEGSSLLAPQNALAASLLEELARIDKPQLMSRFGQLTLPRRFERWREALSDDIQNSKVALKADPQEPFDQVIPLRISLKCYIRISDNVWKYWMASPQIVEFTAGRLHACSRVDTRMTRIVVSKQLAGLHADGSLHLENALFLGRTAMTAQYRSAFSFEARTRAPFWTSGRLGDQSKPMIRDTVIDVVRSGTWALHPHAQVRGKPIISDVRGTILAWAYINPDRIRYSDTGMPITKPGEFIIASVSDPEAYKYVNTWIVGGYRGVVADVDGDGQLDLAPTPSFATFDGEIDRNRDGKPDVAGLHYDICEGIIE